MSKTPEKLKSLGGILFQGFVCEYGKTYDSEDEYKRRRDIYHGNLQTIRNHNYATRSDGTPKHSWVMTPNQFTDMLPEEVPMGLDKSSLHGLRAQQAFSGTSSLSDPGGRRRNLRDLPTSVDWRTHKPRATTPTKNQGHCGSCWAVASTTVLESHLAIATGKLLELSSQELVSCLPNPDHCGGNGGCDGSTQELAFDYVSKHGLLTEWPGGYTSYYGQNGNCTRAEDSVGPRVSIVGFATLPSNSYDNLMWTVATIGPVVISVAANLWFFYRGGIFDDSHITHYDINHAVVLEGYGTDDRTGEDYWLVRNSWGEHWGENGYIRLKRTDPSTLGAENPLSVSSGYCKMDITPLDGVACAGPDGNAPVDDQLVCGTSGILYSTSIPVGVHLVDN
eukprot:jgi/Psemu1/261843/estExt_Genewise1Plus.C_6330011